MHFISDFTQKAVLEVFDTMLSLAVDPEKAYAGADMPHDTVSGIVGNVSFAGKVSGSLYMNYSPTLACKLTERMIGDAPTDVEQPEVSDVIGELANMVSGTMKRYCSEVGYDGWLSPPIVLKGDNVVIEGKGAPIAIYNAFRIPELNAELGVRVFVKFEG